MRHAAPPVRERGGISGLWIMVAEEDGRRDFDCMVLIGDWVGERRKCK